MAKTKSKSTIALAPLDPLQRYTVIETLRYLRTSRQSLYTLINDNTLKVIKQGARTYVPGTEIVRLSQSAST